MPEKYFPAAKVYVAQSAIKNAGLGVFAHAPIEQGEIIEQAPVIEVTNRFERFLLKRTALRNYYYQWGPERKQVALSTGYGSLYNHAYEPNASYEKNIKENYITFTALRPIQAGEEITVNYNGRPHDATTLWINGIPPADSI